MIKDSRLTLNNPKTKIITKKSLIGKKSIYINTELSKKKSPTFSNPSKKITTKKKDKVENLTKKARRSALLLQKPPFTVDEYNSILVHLQKVYPNCFPSQGVLRPLMRGIHHQLFKQDLPFARCRIRAFLKVYTNKVAYRDNLVLRNSRFDLNGNPVDFVTEDDLDKTKWWETKESTKRLHKKERII